MGRANAPRGENEAALPHAQPEPKHCACNIRLIIRDTLYPHKIHSTAAKHWFQVIATPRPGCQASRILRRVVAFMNSKLCTDRGFLHH